MTSLPERVARRARLWAGFRCEEPVVVLESDDWGLRRRPSADAVAAWGRPTSWAHERSETRADVEALAEVLARHRDPAGRTAAMTMNLVTANADFDAIEAGGFAEYLDVPVDETLEPGVRATLRSGVEAHLFSLQLHGRSHLHPGRWLEDVRHGHPAARALFAARVDGGLSLVAEESWRYHSEFVDWATGRARTVDELSAWLAPAVATIERLGGERPRATAAPHYVLTDQAEQAWAGLGIDFVQAAEYRLIPGRERPRTSYLGRPGRHGLTHLTRTVRFDPRPHRPRHHLVHAETAVGRCFATGLPAVIDTHRINYTGPWAAEARRQLDALLTVADDAGARYLTTPELGDAVVGDGAFGDWATGAPRRLTPRGTVARSLTRVVMPRR